MPQQRGTETSQLANVIEVLQLGRKTGILSVERDTNSSLEMGEISFQNGHITQASSKQGLHGTQALLWLRSWDACRFIFVPAQETALTTKPLPAVSQQDLVQKKRDTQPQRVPPKLIQAQTPAAGIADELLVVPQRTQELESALQFIAHAHLSRTHRQLFLLIDGQRNAKELFRLIGRSQDSGFTLLRDLAYIGVIR